VPRQRPEVQDDGSCAESPKPRLKSPRWRPSLASAAAGAFGAHRKREEALRSPLAYGGEPVGQLARAAETDVVAAVHLVGVDVEALAGVASRPPHWDHAVVAAEEVPRRRLRPGLERPWLRRLRSLVAFSSPRLGRQLRRDVVVEDVLVPTLLVAGVRPPVCEELPGDGIIAATRTRSSTGIRPVGYKNPIG
jgi:hypothetical protein